MNNAKYDSNKYTIWVLPHPVLLHWILNPGLAFNELILGQRLPKVTLVDKTLDKPFLERSFIPCPHCNHLHDGRLWSGKNQYGHWFGYVCPSCGEIIPCLWNLTSLVILAITCPLWFIPVKLWKTKWLNFEKVRLNNILVTGFSEYKDIAWLKVGVKFGGLMWLIVGIAPQIVIALIGYRFNWQFTVFSFVLCTVLGILFAVMMKFFMGLKPNHKMPIKK